MSFYVVEDDKGRPIITGVRPANSMDIMFTARNLDEAREWRAAYIRYYRKPNWRTFRIILTSIVIIVTIIILAGCSSVPRSEFAWQALHAIDVAQTVQIARSDCYREGDDLTRRIIGEDPTVAGALAWGVGIAGLHFGVSRWLQEIESPRWVQAAWQVLTIANTGHATKNNFDQGIDPWGTDC